MTNLKGLVTSSSPFSPLSDMVAVGSQGLLKVVRRQWQGGGGQSGDGSRVVRLRWFDPRRFVHTQFARRFPGEQAPRALSVCVPVTKPAKHFRPQRRRQLSTLHSNCKATPTANMFKVTRALSMQPTRMMAMQPTRMMAMRQSPQLFMRQTMALRKPMPVRPPALFSAV